MQPQANPKCFAFGPAMVRSDVTFTSWREMKVQRTLYPIARIGHSDFDRIRTIMHTEADFPTSYFQWEQLTIACKDELEDGGVYEAQFIDVNPAAFRQFLKDNRIPAGWDGLGQYVATVAAQRNAQRKSEERHPTVGTMSLESERQDGLDDDLRRGWERFRTAALALFARPRLGVRP